MYIPLPIYYCIPARLERLTINEKIPPLTNERITEIKKIKYPPKNIVNRYGRCNIVNDSMLYGAFNLLTLASEITPDIGKAITHSKWKLKAEVTLKMLPIFFITSLNNEPHNSLSLEILELHEEYLSNFSEADKKVLNIAMEFLAKCFAKEVETTNHFDYFLSAYTSKKAMDMEIGYDGIIYPSVKTRLGFSDMAIKPEVFDNKFVLVEVLHEINTIPPGKNGINHAERTTKFDLDIGLIIWD